MEHNGSGIGVGITTRNRPEVLEYCLRQFDRHTPAEIRIVVIDDNSDDPNLNELATVPYGEYYFNEVRLGVAKSKNECIKKLKGYTHIFLFDDDCFPICGEWWKPWLVGEHHMVFSPGKGVRKLKEKSKEVEGGLGCCLYFSRHCLDVVGGFDPEFGLWGYEHAEITNRIYCAGLTSYTYISPLEPNVFSFDYSGSHRDGDDYYEWKSISSVAKADKPKLANDNVGVFNRAIPRMRAGDVKRDIWKS